MAPARPLLAIGKMEDVIASATAAGVALVIAVAVFKSTAPKYLRKQGLLRKHYYVTETGDRAGGIYLWKSKADAEACYTAEWKAMVTEKYGAAPDILYAHVPVSVDNLQEVIEAA